MKGAKPQRTAGEWRDDDWRRVVDAIEIPIVVLGDDLRVVRANRAVSLLTGRTDRDMTGTPIGRLAPGQLWHSAADVAATVAEHRSPSPTQVRDDAGRTWDVLAMPFHRDDPQDRRVIVMAWDVTHATELRAELDRGEQMSRMGELVAGVAHEVRSPLFAISATVEALEQLIGQDHADYFQVLREEVGRLSELMQDLLEYGRPSPLSRQITSTKDIVQAAVNAAQRLAQSRDVQIVVEGCHESAALDVDTMRIQRALENILSNAIHHSSPGRRVLVRCREVVERGRTFHEVAVLDEGPGIPPDDLPRLFEPFFSRRPGGTGLGLSIVSRTIDEHQGELTAANRPEGGASFVIRLPASTAAAAGA